MDNLPDREILARIAVLCGLAGVLIMAGAGIVGLAVRIFSLAAWG